MINWRATLSYLGILLELTVQGNLGLFSQPELTTKEGPHGTYGCPL